MRREIKEECRRVRESFSAMIDGSDDVFSRKHFSDCRECHSEYEKFTKTIKMVQAMPEIKAPPFFAAKLMQRIQEKPDRSPLLIPLPRIAYAAATVTLLLLFVQPIGIPENGFQYLLTGIPEHVRKVSEYMLPRPERVWNTISSERDSDIEWMVGNARILDQTNQGRWDVTNNEVQILQTSYGF